MPAPARLAPELAEFIRALARADASEDIARRFGRKRDDEARSDLRQSEASAEDQARMCAEHALKMGWEVVDTFVDAAISGARRDRPGLNRMLARAAEFDLVLAESIDRLSRDQEDIAGIHKRLRFAGVEIVTLQDGEVGELHIGLKGTMAAMFLRDLAQKTKRGQLGRVAAGRIPGGLSYGYAKVQAFDGRGEPERGLRAIDEAEAAIVRRIFRQYLAGTSPRAIAHQLNAEGVQSPRGALWRASTIVGSRQRRNGILNNELYAGRIVYNRQSFIRHPDSRRRIARPNPRELWKVQEVPDLRIVDEASWAAVQARFARHADRPARAQLRPRKLFSRLLRCGECGGTVTIITGGRWGCSNNRQTGTCGNNRLTTNQSLERRVLGALTHDLLSAEAIEIYVREYHRQAERELAERTSTKSGLQQQLRVVDARVKRLVAAIADGADVAEIRDVLVESSAERDRLREELASIDAERVIPLHPRLADSYRKRIAELSAALEGPEEKRAEAKAALRGLIDRIVVHPRADRAGVDLEIHGRLAQILRFAQKKPPLSPAGADWSEDCTVQMVAGVGFEPTTFRL